MLEGKTAIVTGAAGDLGNAMARHLAENGAKVILWDIKSGQETQSALTRVQKHDPGAQYQVVDVRDRSGVDQAMAAIPTIDIVCSNAGIVEAQPFLEVTQQNWQNHLDINLTGCFNVCQAAALKMAEDGTEGRIILTSSWVGQHPLAGDHTLQRQQGRGQYAGQADGARAGAVSHPGECGGAGIVAAGLAGRQLREDPLYAARVAKVIPLIEPGTTEEIAQAVVYLAGPQTAYMTGSILTLDGGCSLFQFDG